MHSISAGTITFLLDKGPQHLLGLRTSVPTHTFHILQSLEKTPYEYFLYVVRVGHVSRKCTPERDLVNMCHRDRDQKVWQRPAGASANALAAPQ